MGRTATSYNGFKEDAMKMNIFKIDLLQKQACAGCGKQRHEYIYALTLPSIILSICEKCKNELVKILKEAK